MQKDKILEIWMKNGMKFEVGKNCVDIRVADGHYFVTIEDDPTIGYTKSAIVLGWDISVVVKAEWKNG